MDLRAFVVCAAVTLTACVPIRKTYYEAVGGEVGYQETLATCPPTFFVIGKFPAPSLSAVVETLDGKPQLRIRVATGRSTEIDFEPRYLTLESLSTDRTRTEVPLSMYVGGLGNSNLPIHVLNPTEISYLYFIHPIPAEMEAGFVIHIPRLKGDKTTADPIDLIFRRVTKYVATGTFGCGL